jgi:hypothetical protein
MKTQDSTVLEGLRRQGELADAIFSASGIVLTSRRIFLLILLCRSRPLIP